MSDSEFRIAGPHPDHCRTSASSAVTAFLLFSNRANTARIAAPSAIPATYQIQVHPRLAGACQTLTPLADRTTFVVVGDNGSDGYVSQWPDNKGKQTVYEGGVRVPLIVSGLNVADVGRESTALVNTTDLFSTALELLGVNVSTALAGVTLDSESILPILQDAQATGSRDTVYVEAFQEQCSFNWRQAIRDDQYKLLRFCPPCTGGECCYDSADCSEELYAVSDVLECCDLAGDPNYDDEREALRLLLPAPPGADIECRAGDLCKGCCQDSDCSSTTGTCHLDVHECCPDPYAGLTVQWDGPPGDPEPRGISTLGDYEAFNMVEGGACVHNLVLKTAFDEDSQSQVTQYRAGRVQGGAPDSLGIVTASWEGSNFGNITV